MKSKLTQLFFLSMVVSLFITAGTSSQSQQNPEPQKNDSITANYRDSMYNAMKEMQKAQKEMQNQYKKQMEEQSDMNGGQPSMFGVRLDLIFGYTGTNSTYESTNSIGGVQTGAKNGGFAGANITLTLMGFSFTTGLSYSSKGFKTNTGNQFDMNYINLPIMMSFDFKVGKKVIIEPSIGPYIGIGLSNNNSDSLMKNIDIGIIGNLQGTYMFHKHIGALVGFKYEYGGLNNMSSNSAAQIKTKTWALYSGVKFVF
jgi:hypothetical protein